MISLLLKSDALIDLQKKAQAIGKETDAAMVGARGAANLVRNHLFNLDQSGANQMGGVRTHFYSSAAKSITEPEQIGEGNVAFSITKVGLAQRWLGGTITAGKGISSSSGGPTKYLAIPARSEAYGKTPAEFDDLTFVPTRAGHAMLVQALQTEMVKGKGKDFHTREVGGLVMFWLTTEVTQQPDPAVMPTEDDINEAARYSMDNYLSRLLATGGAN
jgi:hypothetical protein